MASVPGGIPASLGIELLCLSTIGLDAAYVNKMYSPPETGGESGRSQGGVVAHTSCSGGDISQAANSSIVYNEQRDVQIPGRIRNRALIIKSISGARRFNPFKTRPSRSASAWNLILMSRSPELGDQFRVRLARTCMLGFRRVLFSGKVGINLALIAQIKRERAMHLFQRQCRVAFHHALGRHSFSEKID